MDSRCLRSVATFLIRTHIRSITSESLKVEYRTQGIKISSPVGYRRAHLSSQHWEVEVGSSVRSEARQGYTARPCLK